MSVKCPLLLHILLFGRLEFYDRILTLLAITNLRGIFFSIEKTFTRTVVCLADKEQLHVPTSADKIHRNNLLGYKKVSISATASKERVKEVLYE